MPVTVNLLENPLNPTERRILKAEPGIALSVWLKREAPSAWVRRGRLAVLRNEVEVFEDFVFAEGDTVSVVVVPAGAEAWAAFFVETFSMAEATAAVWAEVAAFVTTVVVNAAINALIQAFMGKPDQPRGDRGSGPNPIYNVGGAPNAARLGGPIPELYGEAVALPDFATTPYTYYLANEQYLNVILCVSGGHCETVDVLLGETSVRDLSPSVVRYWTFNPTVSTSTRFTHDSTLGRIESVTGIHENVYSSPEAFNVDLLAINEEIGDPAGVTNPRKYYWRRDPPIMSRATPGGRAYTEYNLRRWYIDGKPDPAPGFRVQVQYGGGGGGGPIWFADYIATPWTNATGFDDGDILPDIPDGVTVPSATGDHWVGWFIVNPSGTTVQRVEVDIVAPGGVYKMDQKTGLMETYTAQCQVQIEEIDNNDQPVVGGVTRDLRFDIITSTQTPQRRTFLIKGLKAARYRARVRNALPIETDTTSGFPKAGLMRRLQMTGFKGFLDYVPGSLVYGDVTLIALNIKASEGLSSEAYSRIKVRARRHISHADNPTAIGPTSNPADIVRDLWLRAGLQEVDIDMVELRRLRAKWATYPHGFNGIFESTSLWECLTSALQVTACSPMAIGSGLSFVQDGARPLTALFTPENTANVNITYDFDPPDTPTGLIVEYRNPRTFDPEALFDGDQDNAETVKFFGCTNKEHAEHYVALHRGRQQYRRRSVTFDTGQEALALVPGTRVRLITDVVNADNAFTAMVHAVAGATLTLDRPYSWDPAVTYTALCTNEFGEIVDLGTVARGAFDEEVVSTASLAGLRSWDGVQEASRIVIHATTRMPRDFTVLSCEPSDNELVKVTATTYNDAIFAGSYPFLLTA